MQLRRPNEHEQKNQRHLKMLTLYLCDVTNELYLPKAHL